MVRKLFCAFIAILFLTSSAKAEIEREHDFNFDWKFTLVESPELPKQVPLDDTDWREIRLPHDWSVEFPFDSIWEGATGIFRVVSAFIRSIFPLQHLQKR